MIPKIIHTCWFSKSSVGEDLPQEFKEYIEFLSENYPSYEIKVWTCSNWDEIRYNDYAKKCWECGIMSYPYLKDYFKFWVLSNYGGWYFEANNYLEKSIFENISKEENLIFFKDKNNKFSGEIMASNIDNPLIKNILRTISHRSWINPDQSLNIYNFFEILEKEIESFGYSYPRLSQENFISNKISIYINGILKLKTSQNNLGKKLSVIIPFYNSENYIKEAIDSVLSQEYNNYEVICIDDGSTDLSGQIVQSYNDDRVVYIKKNHSGIVDSLNMGIRRALGEYLVRMDSDDIMLPNRLSHQSRYMDINQHIDILGSGFQWGNGKSEPEYFQSPKRDFKITDFRVGNLISHPSVIMRKSSIMKLPYIYENYFQGCEDYKLWHHALHHGLTVSTEPTPVIIYRQHSGQETSKGDYFTKTLPLLKQIKRMYYEYKEEYPEKVELTCIIPFQNEGSEIERTVANIRGTAGNEVKIILINDASTDNYNYKWIADNYGCQYIQNDVNLGVAASRDLGVKNCTTEYFVLLDGHMRFYHDNWQRNLLVELKKNPNCLVTSNTIVITYDKDTKTYSNEAGWDGRDKFGSYGAYVNMDEAGWEFTGKWTNKIMSGISDTESVIPISCCMGAVYACSVSFWKKIGGLKGLIKYGLDEPLISIKTWLAGGKVLLMKDWGVGHLYRGTNPYSIPLKHLDQNQIYLINLFCCGSKENLISVYENRFKDRIGESRFLEAKKVFNENIQEFLEFKRYFYSEVAKNDLDWYLNEINKKCY